MGVLSALLETDRALFDRMTSEARRACFSFARGSDDLDDMMSESWVRALARQHTLRSPSKVIPWFIALARNVCADMVKRRSGEERQATEVAYELGILGGGGGGDETPVLNQQLDYDIESLEIALPAEQRRVVHLRTTSRKTYGEIGIALGISADAAQKRFERARQTLVQRARELLKANAELDEPETWPPAMRVITAVEMQLIIEDMRARGIPLSADDEDDLLNGLPKRRDWRSVY